MRRCGGTVPDQGLPASPARGPGRATRTTSASAASGPGFICSRGPPELATSRTPSGRRHSGCFFGSPRRHSWKNAPVPGERTTTPSRRPRCSCRCLFSRGRPWETSSEGRRCYAGKVGPWGQTTTRAGDHLGVGSLNAPGDLTRELTSILCYTNMGPTAASPSPRHRRSAPCACAAARPRPVSRGPAPRAPARLVESPPRRRP